MKASELRQLSREELITELANQRETLFRLRVRRATGEAAEASESTRVRRDIARILTVLREQALSEAALSSEQGAQQDG